MFRKRQLMTAFLLCTTTVLFSGELLSRDNIQLQRYNRLFVEFGSAPPIASYPIRASEMYNALVNLLNSMENRETVLLERINRWEERKAKLEQEILDAQQEADESTRNNALQILVWPPPEEEPENAFTAAIEDLYSWRPHEQLEDLQVLLARVEDELEALSRRQKSSPMIFSQQTAVQGFWNQSPDDLPFDQFQDVVQPVFRASSVWGRNQGAGLQLTSELRRQYNQGMDITNLPLPEDQDALVVDMNLLSEIQFTVGYQGGYISTGRFPVHIGPGSGSLSSSNMFPYHEGARLVVAADEFRTSHVLSILNRTGQDLTRLLVIHYAELSNDSWRVGFGGQNLFLQSSLLGEMQHFLPIVGWLVRSPGSVNTQVFADITYIPISDVELYIQTGIQSTPGGWLADIPGGAIIAGARYMFPAELADTSVTMEGGITGDTWGDFPETDYRYQHRFFAPNSEVYLSSPYGPAAIWGGGAIDVQLTGGAQFGLFMDLRAQKPLDPLGDAYEFTGSLGVRFGYRFENVLTMYIQPVLYGIGDQVNPGVSAGLRVRSSTQLE